MRKMLLGVGLLFLGGALRADEPTGGYFDDTQIPCVDASSEVSRGRCHRDALMRADQELNALYQELLSLADEGQEQQLRRMQRAWIALKEAQCAFVVDYHGGAANPGKFGTYCEAVMTIRRVRELQQLGTGLLWRREH